VTTFNGLNGITNKFYRFYYLGGHFGFSFILIALKA